MQFAEQDNYYTINHIVLFTGLTDRTIRNYMSMGILQGEKTNGTWHFTPEQVEEFVRHPTVRPSILAKKNALIYDFLADTKKKSEQSCMILDLPGDKKKDAMEFFCSEITNGDFYNVNFSFDGIDATGRIILKGDSGEVMRLLNSYYSR